MFMMISYEFDVVTSTVEVKIDNWVRFDLGVEILR
jgi:hypothetical protein